MGIHLCQAAYSDFYASPPAGDGGETVTGKDKHLCSLLLLIALWFVLEFVGHSLLGQASILRTQRRALER